MHDLFLINVYVALQEKYINEMTETIWNQCKAEDAVIINVPLLPYSN